MKSINKIHFAFLFLIFTNSIYSQTTGVKFAPDRSHWSEQAAYRIGSWNGAYVTLYENIYIKSDTLINTKYCQKIFTSNSQTFDTTCLHFSNYIYYKNRRLYSDTTIAIDTTSIMQYDFNLIAGDTFNLYLSNTVGCNGHNGYYKIPVDYTDSMYYGNKWRKRIVFKNMVGFDFGSNPITWVEGIGDIEHGLGYNIFPIANYGYGIYGGLQNFYGNMEHCYCNSMYVHLNCFQEIGFSTYGSNCNTGSCITALNHITKITSIYIYPNPAKETIYIENTKNHSIKINVFDVFGKEVIEEKESNSEKIEICLNSLSEGMYFIKIKTKIGTQTEKMIIQR